MNLNDLAKEVCKLEKGKKEVNIAQVKEVIRCLCVVIGRDPIGVTQLLLKRAVKLKK